MPASITSHAIASDNSQYRCGVMVWLVCDDASWLETELDRVCPDNKGI